MRIGSTFALAFRRLRRRPVRSFLLLQGTVWGVAVTIFPSAVIDGTRAAAREHATALGADRIVCVADPTSSAPINLDRGDVVFARETLNAEGHTAVAVAGIRVRGKTPAGITLLEATPEAPQARGLELAAGRWLAPTDTAEQVVIEAGVAGARGLDIQPGQRIEFAGTLREVVGITKARTAQQLRTSDLGFDLEHDMYDRVAQQFLLAMGIPHIAGDQWKRGDTCVYIPAPDTRTTSVEWLYVRVAPAQLSQAAQALRAGLAERDKAVVTLYPLVLPVILGDDVDRFGAVNLAMFLACLLMGAVVMANLGLLNALSRSREIAIRRVEGATRGDIAGHFLIEGILLNLVGCGLGCVLGMGLAELRASVEPAAGFTWAFPVRHALIACGVAMLIGIAAAVLPALRASGQDPVRGLADD